MVIDRLLTEIMRPQTMEEIVLLDRIRKSVGEGEIITQNFLLESSSPGTGKTSLAKVLASGKPTLYFNASSEGRIEYLRDTVSEFCSTRSMLNTSATQKIVIMDELDGASSAFHDALRPVMERFTDNIRFIGTCNYISKVPDPIKSRFNHIKFYPLNEEEEQELTNLYYKRIVKVSKMIEIGWESKETLLAFIKKYFPDIRTMFTRLQDFTNSGVKKITLDLVKKTSFSYEDLYELMASKPNPIENYKMIMANFVGKVNDVFYSLGQEFPSWLEEKKPDKLMALPQCLIHAADYEFKSRASIDPVLSLLACVFSIQKAING